MAHEEDRRDLYKKAWKGIHEAATTLGFFVQKWGVGYQASKEVEEGRYPRPVTVSIELKAGFLHHNRRDAPYVKVRIVPKGNKEPVENFHIGKGKMLPIPSPERVGPDELAAIISLLEEAADGKLEEKRKREYDAMKEIGPRILELQEMTRELDE